MSGRARLALCAWRGHADGRVRPAAAGRSGHLDRAGGVPAGRQTGVGAAARRVPLARPLTVAAQALVTLLLLTLVFARRAGGPRAAARARTPSQQFGRLLRQGVRRRRRGTRSRRPVDRRHPADADRRRAGDRPRGGRPRGDVPQRGAGRAAAARAVLGGRGAVRRAARAGCWFLVAAAGYLLLLLAEGRDRLSQWGRVFGGPRRRGPAAAGSRLGRRQASPRSAPAGGSARWRSGIALVVPAGAARAGRRAAGRRRQRRGRRQRRRRHDLRGEPAGVPAGQPEPARGPRGPVRYRTDRHRHPRPVSADRRPGPVRRHDLEAVRAARSRTSRTSFRDPAGLGSDVSAPDQDHHLGGRAGTPRTGCRCRTRRPRWTSTGAGATSPQGRTLVGDRGQNTRGLRSTRSKSLEVQPTAGAAGRGAGRRPAACCASTPRSRTRCPPVVAEHRAPGHRGRHRTPTSRRSELQDWFAVDGGFAYDTEVRSGSGSAGDRPVPAGRSRASASTSPSRWRRWPARWAYRPGSRWASRPAPRRRTARCRSGSRTRTPGPSCTSRAWAGPASSRPRAGARARRTRMPGHPGQAAAPGPARRPGAAPRRRPPRRPRRRDELPAAAREAAALRARVRRRPRPPDERRSPWATVAGLVLAAPARRWLLPAGADAVAAADARRYGWRAHGRGDGGRAPAHAGGLAGADRHGVGLRHPAGRVADPAQGGRADRPAGTSWTGRPRPRCTGWRTRWSRCCTHRSPGRRPASREDVRRRSAGLRARGRPGDAAARAARPPFHRTGGVGGVGVVGRGRARAAAARPTLRKPSGQQG